MAEDQDWIWSATFDLRTGGGTEANIIYGKYEWDGSREDRLWMISYNGADDTYGFKVGNDTGGWSDNIVSGLTFGAWQDLTVHYQVGLGFDFWVGDTKVVEDAQTGHGRYDMSFTNVEWLRGTSVNAWRNFKVGQVPEPMTMILLGAGVLGLVRRRKA